MKQETIEEMVARYKKETEKKSEREFWRMVFVGSLALAVAVAIPYIYSSYVPNPIPEGCYCLFIICIILACFLSMLPVAKRLMFGPDCPLPEAHNLRTMRRKIEKWMASTQHSLGESELCVTTIHRLERAAIGLDQEWADVVNLGEVGTCSRFEKSLFEARALIKETERKLPFLGTQSDI